MKELGFVGESFISLIVFAASALAFIKRHLVKELMLQELTRPPEVRIEISLAVLFVRPSRLCSRRLLIYHVPSFRILRAGAMRAIELQSDGC